MTKTALIIGAQEYDASGGITQLACARNDALAFGRLLRERCGFGAIRVLAGENVAGSDGRPTKMAIRNEIRRLAQSPDRIELLVVAICAHGWILRVGDAERFYVAPEDAHSDEPDTLLEYEDLMRRLDQIPAEQRAIIFDTCRNRPESGRGGGDNLLARDLGIELLEPKHRVLDTTTAVMSACSVGERAFEMTDAGHGVFFHFLLQGMEGPAWSANGLSVNDAFGYAQREIAARPIFTQRPTFKQNGGRVIFLAEAAPAFVTLADEPAALDPPAVPPGPAPTSAATGPAAPPPAQSAPPEPPLRPSPSPPAPGPASPWKAPTRPAVEHAHFAQDARPKRSLLSRVGLAVWLIIGAVGGVVWGIRSVAPLSSPPEPVTQSTLPRAASPELAAAPGYPVAVGQSFRDEGCPGGCPEMVVIPPGSVRIGAPQEYFFNQRQGGEWDQRLVHLRAPLAVGRFAVTFAEWDACVADGGCRIRPGDGGWGRGRRPVVNVSWHDAQEYVDWLRRRTGRGYRLLWEQEREYATRGQTEPGQETPFFTGSSISLTQANFFDNSRQSLMRTQPVGSYPPNAFGLFDMAGNIKEWVGECSGGTQAAASDDVSVPTAQTGDCEWHILRGGSFLSGRQWLRSAFRSIRESSSRDSDLGFRVARTPG